MASGKDLNLSFTPWFFCLDFSVHLLIYFFRYYFVVAPFNSPPFSPTPFQWFVCIDCSYSFFLQLFPAVFPCEEMWLFAFCYVFFFSETTRYVKINPLSTRKKKQKRKQLLATRTSAWQDACVARKKQFLTTFNFQTVYATNKYQTEKFRSAKQSPKPTWHDRYHGEVKLVLWRMTFQDGADLK